MAAVYARVVLPQLAPDALARYVAIALTAYTLVLVQTIDRPAKQA